MQEIGERHGLLYTMITIILFTPISNFLAGGSHEERTKELEIGKIGMYAVPFRSATVAIAAVPQRGVYREGGRRKKK